ncbi:MAG TPA: DUF742 domain-containing protein [Actinophytocola sp.]|uniref:DUF742 domain-containing protein n=1 Tax=Actinophytocola sp. TaxID=1872138 RepID=UPI002F9244F8
MTGFFGPPPDGAAAGPGQTFADVVDELTLGGGRHKRRKRLHPSLTSTMEQTGPVSSQEIVPHAGRPAPPSPVPRPYPRPVPRPETHLDAVEAELADAADAAIVRPYAWTRGRTRATMDLRIEALVTTSELGADIEALTQTEHRCVAELCGEPRSVAEVATLLHVPLGVAKVLLGDMANLGLVIVHKTATGGANKAHLVLMERVLSGLRRL